MAKRLILVPARCDRVRLAAAMERARSFGSWWCLTYAMVNRAEVNLGAPASNRVVDEQRILVDQAVPAQ